MSIRPRARGAAAVLLGLATFGMSSPRAQARRPMTLVDIAELPRLLVPQLSPDGRTLVYFLSGEDWKAGRPVYHMWRQNIGGGAAVQLTFSQGGDAPTSGLTRAPAPMTAEAYRGEVCVMDAGGENARALTSNTIEEHDIDLSADGMQVLFVADTNERFEPYYPTNLFIVPAVGGTPRALLPDFGYAFD